VYSSSPNIFSIELDNINKWNCRYEMERKMQTLNEEFTGKYYI